MASHGIGCWVRRVCCGRAGGLVEVGCGERNQHGRCERVGSMYIKGWVCTVGPWHAWVGPVCTGWHWCGWGMQNEKFECDFELLPDSPVLLKALE